MVFVVLRKGLIILSVALEKNQEVFKNFIKKYSVIIKDKKTFNDDDSLNGFFAFMKYWKDWLYDNIHNFLSNNKYNNKFEITIRTYCNYIRDKILPVCNAKIKYYRNSLKKDSHVYLNKWLDLEDDFYALASYRNLRMLALYLERGKSNKIWNDTIHLFENFFDYAQRLVFGEQIEVIRASYFPGAGKTYAGNILCAFWFGVDEEMSILRITYSDDLCAIFINQIGDIIDSKQYRKVFPKFDIGEEAGNKNSKLYKKFSVEVGFQFTFSSVMNFFASTRDGQTTGKRGKVLIIDDLTKGEKEAYDEKLHKSMENRYDTEWCSRADSSYQPVIALGTMWSEFDLLNKIYDRAMKDTNNNIIDSDIYKYTKLAINEDGSVNSVFISVPILDYETDESTCPLRYTTAKMRKKRNNMDERLWNSVYQQRPTPPETMLFDYKKLLTYNNETYPLEQMKNRETQCWAFIDPTRKGNDFFAMGIFKRCMEDDGKWSKWYLLDCIFDQMPTKELMYDIANKILTHNCTKLGYENNVDMSFDDLLRYKLKEIGYRYYLDIDSYFSNDNKETKIRNACFGMRKEIIYPAMNMYANNSPMGKAMNQLTKWNIGQKSGDHDDFPDMISMFIKYYGEDVSSENSITILDRSVYSLR